jgi:hypothetical protein
VYQANASVFLSRYQGDAVKAFQGLLDRIKNDHHAVLILDEVKFSGFQLHLSMHTILHSLSDIVFFYFRWNLYYVS